MLNQIRIQRIADSLIEFIEPQSSVLDIGCGTGLLGQELKKTIDFEIEGIDLVPHHKNYIPITVSNAPYPFADNSFDTTLCIFTLHHMEVPELGLREAVRLARKNVILLEDVPRNSLERQAIKAVDFLGNRWVNKNIPLPFTYKTDSEWTALFDSMDLVLKKKKTVHPLPFPRLNHVVYQLAVPKTPS